MSKLRFAAFLMPCKDCAAHLEPWMSMPKEEGATPKLLLLCPKCDFAVQVKAINGSLEYHRKTHDKT